MLERLSFYAFLCFEVPLTLFAGGAIGHEIHLPC